MSNARGCCLALVCGLLVGGACGSGDTAAPALQLSFARRALDGPCPEVPGDPAPPPDLERVEVTLWRNDGSVHYRGSSAVGGQERIHLGGIAAATDLLLEVRGLVGGRPAWMGAATGVSIRDGVDTTVPVFLTPSGDVACAARPLSSARAFMAAAPLPDGRALLAGGLGRVDSDGCGPGCDLWVATSAVDVFDAGTGIIHPLARLNTPRALASATVLADGSILVVGGVSRLRLQSGDGMFVLIDEQDLVQSFELYLPGPNVWVEGPLPQGMVFHTATRLPDGRVLLAGGGTAPDEEHTSRLAYLYLPQSGSRGEVVAVTSAMMARRLGHVALLSPAGKVLLVGGAILATAPPIEEFVPDDEGGVFVEKASEGIAANLFFAAAAIIPLRPDEAWLAGGRIFDGRRFLPADTRNSRIIRRLSGDTVQWAEGPELSQARWLGELVRAGEQLVLAGGFSSNQLDSLAAIEVFDPQGQLTVAANASVARAGAAAVPLAGARVLLAGGLGTPGMYRSAELFTVAPQGE